MNYNSKEISNLGIYGELESNDINLESETESLKNEKRNLDKLKELLNYSSDDDSFTQYDVVYENGHYFIRELSSSEKIKQKLSTGSEDHQFSLKDRFISWYESIAPDKHRQWFKKDLKGKINEIENKYNLSFYKSLFEINLDSVTEEIAIIQTNLAKWSPIDKSLQIFENYNRMTKGISKEIILYYLDFLKNKEHEKDL
jgi:hypothetical protein